MSKQHFNFKSSIRDWYIRAFPSDQIGYRINPLATFAGAVKCMADGGDIYKYLGVGDSLVRENVFSKIAAITGVDYDAVYDLWLHHDEDECSRLVFLGDHPDCAVDRDWREQFDEVASPSEQVRYDEMLAAEEHRKAETFDSFMEVNETPMDEVRGADCLFACHVDIDGVYAQRTGNPDGLRAYCDPMGVGWNYGPIYYFPRESIEQVVGQLCEDGDDFPILFDGNRVIEAFDGTPVHMSVPVEVDGEKVWTCGYDFCWCETVAPDFSRARGHFPDATVAAWAAARSVNQSDGSMGFKERM